MGRVRIHGPSMEAGGFTLLELVVAVFIIALMTAVVTPNLIGIGHRAQQTACEQNQRMIRAALTEYYLIYHQYPTGTVAEQLQTLEQAELLQTIPTEPSGGHYDILLNNGTPEVTCDVHGTLGDS